MNSYENEQLSYECDLTAERDRLREVNAELVAALENFIAAGDGPMPYRAQAIAAIAKAKS